MKNKYLIFFLFVLGLNTVYAQNNMLLHEDFEDDSLDSRISIQKTGAYNSNPNIKDNDSFGSQKAYGFGRSMCGASCSDNYATRMIISFSSPVYIDSLNFGEIELYGNWGGKGQIYINGTYLQGSYFGRSPSNDRVADTDFRERNFIIDKAVQSIELKVWDITNSSEVFIDDLKIFGIAIQAQNLQIEPASLDMGTAVEKRMSTKEIVLSNVGSETISISRVRIQDSSADRFLIDRRAFNLAAGENRTMSVQFLPDAVGNYAAKLVFESTQGNIEVPLLGVGVVPNTASHNTVFSNVLLNGMNPVANVAAGASLSMSFNYQTWSRTGCPGCVIYICAGVEGDGQGTKSIGIPGRHPGRSGSGAITLKAPAQPGLYTIYGFHAPVLSSGSAISEYESGFLSSAHMPVALIAVIEEDAPPPPSNLSATQTCKGVSLNWDSNNDNLISKYYIYRGILENVLSLIDSVDAEYDDYTDTDTRESIDYFYRIRSIDNNKRVSGFSNSATIFTKEVSSENLETSILSFGFDPSKQSGDAIIDTSAHTVNVQVNNGTDLTNLIASFTLSDCTTVKVIDVVQKSEVTENDFTNPVIYTIISDDGVTFQDWEVTVTVAQNIEIIDLDSGLFAYYPFNGNAKDESGNGNDGTVYGNTVKYVSGVIEQAINFDNSNSGSFTVNDYVELPNISINEMSISFWTKYISGSSTSYSGSIYSVGDNDYQTKSFRIVINNNGVIHAGIVKNNEYYSTTGIDLSNHDWYFISVTINHDLMKIYRNDSLIDTIELGFDLSFENLSQQIALHKFNNGMSSRFTGSLDDVRIYNRALTIEEINALYNQNPDPGAEEKPTPPKDLTVEVEEEQTTITWTPNTESDLQYYRIYRDLYSPPTTLIDSVLASANTYLDTTNSEGQTWFYTITAIDNEFYESDFSNGTNTFVEQFPDLEVTFVEAPSEISSGQILSVSWQVNNVGNEGTQVPEWFDRVYLSTSPEFNPNSSKVLGTYENFSYLAANEAYKNTAQFTIPKDLFGTHYIHIVTDVKKQLTESDESNNSGSSNSITINLSPFPDLEVTSVLAQDIAFSGDIIEITWNVKNTGTLRTEKEQWFDRIYISEDDNFKILPVPVDGIWRIYETPLGIKEHNGILETESSYTVKANVRIPHTIFGDYHIFVHTDALEKCSWSPHPEGCFIFDNNDIYEYNQEFDNWTSEPIQIVLSDLPDLHVTEIKAPIEASLGEDIEIEWFVQNQGLNDTYESAWSDQVYISSSPTFSTEEAKILGTFSHSGILERDSTYSKKVYVRIPEGFSDPSYIYIKTDYNNQVFEHDFEDNNVTKYDATIDINNPDFIVAEISAPSTAGSGKTIDVNWKIRNQGEGSLYNGSWSDKIYLSKTAVFNTDSVTELGTYSLSGNLLKDSVYNAQKSVVLPNGIEGQYYIFVQTDFNNRVFEADFEENNFGHTISPMLVNLSPWADLVFSSTSVPETATAGDRITINWNVTNDGEASVSETSWTDNIYLSANEIFNQDAQLLKSVEVSRTLDPAASYSQSVLVTLSTDLAGEYYVFVVCDANDNIYEHSDEGNNTSSGSGISVEPYPPIDLTAISISVPDSASSWNPVNIQWSVQNIGAGKTLASNWSDAFYLSADEQFNQDEDILVKYFAHSGALEPGDSYSRNENVKLPDIAGNYYVIIETDTEFNTDDIDNGNNYIVSTNPIHITLSPQADLQVTSLTAPPTVTAGQPVTVEFTVENKGDGNTNTNRWYDGFYLSTDPNFDNSDIRLANYARNGVLKPGGFYTDALEMEIPVYAGGSYFLIVKTDNRDDVYERNSENNNLKVFPISVSVPPPSDLIVTSIVVPASASPGVEITVSWTIENNGENAAVGRMRDAVYISADETWQVEDALLGVVTRDINIPPGSSLKMAQNFSLANTFKADAEGNITEQLPGVLTGEYHAIVRTDIRNNIRESDITNNTNLSNELLDVDVEMLQLGISKNDSLNANESKFYGIQVEEGLDLKLTFQSKDSLSSSEIYVAYGRIPTTIDYDFKASDPFSADEELIVPSTQKGSYYILVLNRNSKSQNFNIKVEGLPFLIFSVKPNYGGSGGNVTSIINGVSFNDSVSVFLRSESGSVISAKVIKYINSTQLKVKWDLHDVASSIYDVVIIKADKSVSELLDGFTVEDKSELNLDYSMNTPGNIRFGSTGLFNFQFQNRSNIDIPYLTFRIVIPSKAEILDLECSHDYFASNHFFQESPCDSCKNHFEITDSINNLSAKIVQLIVKDISPGSKFQVNLLVKPLMSGTFTLVPTYDISDENDFLSETMDKLETFRHIVLENSNDFPELLVQLASNPSQFYQFGIETLNQIDLIDEINLTDDLNLTTTYANNYYNDNCSCESENNLNQNFVKSAQFVSKEQLCKWIAGDLCKAVAKIGIMGGCTPFCLSIGSKFAISSPGGAVMVTAYCWGICWYLMHWGCDKIADYCIPNDTPVNKPSDPNEISGPTGYREKKWISNQSSLPYTIYFENDSILATTSAQLVKITQKLDSTLDARTFRLGSFGFGNYVFNVPENSAFYTQRLDLRDSLGLFLDVSAGIDITKNEIFWQFKSIDPTTGELPVFEGFLPVNDSLGSGQGFVNYTVSPREDSRTGDIVNAQAEIVFDKNAPMLTNNWFNTIDADPPVSEVLPLGAAQDSANFTLQWSGSDIGSGITEYSIYASANNEPFKLWTQNTPYSSDIFNSPFNAEYTFYSIAKDGAGNIEATPLTYDAVTNVVEGITQKDSINLYFETDTVFIDVGETASINLLCDTIFDAYSFSGELFFDAKHLEIDSVNEGSFLNENGTMSTAFVSNVNQDQINIDLNRLGDVGGVTAIHQTELLNLSVKSLQRDTSIIGFTNAGFKCGNELIEIPAKYYKLVVITRINSSMSQKLKFESGWNLFSLPMFSDVTNLETLFQPLIDFPSLLKIQDELGSTYEDWGVLGGWQNNIGSVMPSEGYKIKVSVDDSLEVSGQAVEYPFAIPLKTGWNIIGYPQAGNYNAMNIVQELIDAGTLHKVQDDQGNSIENWGIFGGWLNNIGDFKSGEGYKVKMNADHTLWVEESYPKSIVTQPQLVATTHFKPVYQGNGVDHMNFNFVNLSNEFFTVGDELAVFDGENCVGAITLSTDHFNKQSVSIPASASDKNGMAGFTEGNNYSFKLWRMMENNEVLLSPKFVTGESVFVKNESVILSLEFGVTGLAPGSTELTEVNCYPNPFSNEITIEINLAKESEMEIAVMNQAGQCIKRLLNKQIVPHGMHQLQWTGENETGTRVSTGVYYLRIVMDDTVLNKKIVFNK